MSNFLSDAELASMRASLEDTALPDKGYVLSVTYAYDGQGGVTPSWGTAYSNVPYRLDFKNGFEPVTGGAVRPFSFWELTVPHDTAITTDNRFKDANGNQYSVSSIGSGHSYSLFLTMTVERV